MNLARSLLRAFATRGRCAAAVRHTLLSLPGVKAVDEVRVRRSWLRGLSVAATLTVAGGGPGIAATLDEAARALARRHGATHVDLDGAELL